MKQQKSSGRIVICILTLEFGGAERVVAALANALKKKYASVEILLYYNSRICYDVDDAVKITVIEKETHTQNKLRNMLWMRKYLRDNSDIIISFLASLNMLVLVATMGLKKRKIVADRSNPYKVPSNVLLRECRNFLYRFSNFVVVQTKTSYSYFSSGIQKKTKIICNPTSIKKEDIGVALKTKKEDEIVCVGRLIAVKNPHMLFSAFEGFHKEFPSYHLIWYGEGDLRKELEAWITENGFEDYITLPGTRKDVAREIARAKMFVMTSNYEGMPNALIEAMSIGLPCISTKVAGAVDLIEDGINGFLVETGDVESCKEAMIRFAQNEKMAEDIARNATKITEDLDIERIVAQWVEML